MQFLVNTPSCTVTLPLLTRMLSSGQRPFTSSAKLFVYNQRYLFSRIRGTQSNGDTLVRQIDNPTLIQKQSLGR